MNLGVYRGLPKGRQRTVLVDFIGARATNQATAYSLLNGVKTPIPWDTILYDTGAFWTPTYPTRFTAPHEGWYRVGGGAIVPLGSGSRGFLSLIKTERSGNVVNFAEGGIGNLASVVYSVRAVEHFYEGEYVEVCVAQQTGGTLAGNFATAQDESLCNGWITRIS